MERVDPEEKKITMKDGHVISYDKLCVAPGATPFKPRIPGIDQENVLVLRTHQDQEKIKKILTEGKVKNLVIMGTGFIGSEVAASLKTKY